MESKIKVKIIDLDNNDSPKPEKKKVTYDSQLSFQTSESFINENSLEPQPQAER